MLEQRLNYVFDVRKEGKEMAAYNAQEDPMNGKYTCDMCSRLFECVAAIVTHVETKHAKWLPSDREEITNTILKIKPLLDTLTKANVTKLGEEVLRVASRRDGGPERLREVCAARAQLDLLVKQWNPNARVFVFGSCFVMGVWDGRADIDFSVVDVDEVERGTWPPNEKSAVRSLNRVLCRAGFPNESLNPIKHARVPIIKHHALSQAPEQRRSFFTGGRRNKAQSGDFPRELFSFDFDVGFRTYGIRNSCLLRAYLQSLPLGRCGAMVLKEWSKASGVNNSSQGFLTSYAVNVMWIFYLVRKNFIPFIAPSNIPASLVGNTSFDPTYAPLLPRNNTITGSEGATLCETMGKLFVGFFAFYCFEFDWENEVVSLSRPGVTTKAMLHWTAACELSARGQNVRYQICIEDPYDENLNLGRQLGACRTRKVMLELQRALISLVTDEGPKCSPFSLWSDASGQQITTKTAIGAEQPGVGACVNWLRGECGNKACRFLHEDGKQGSDPNARTVSELMAAAMAKLRGQHGGRVTTA